MDNFPINANNFNYKFVEELYEDYKEKPYSWMHDIIINHEYYDEYKSLFDRNKNLDMEKYLDYILDEVNRYI